ncbi:MAG: CHAT domain-containing protein [Myxococcales bacterium]|nr:CHAT domain-containing protein [Myxococcales bacterium]
MLAPPSNLAGASAEAETIDAVLELRGWAPLALRGDAASGAAVGGERTDAALPHLVGHADDRAALAWDAALELAGGSSLTVADLLALPAPAPPMVVLNGCRTGLADPDAAAGGMSLAHALLVAGAEAVVATTAEIDDAEALALGVAFYEALGAGPPARAAPAALAAALRPSRPTRPPARATGSGCAELSQLDRRLVAGDHRVIDHLPHPIAPAPAEVLEVGLDQARPLAPPAVDRAGPPNAPAAAKKAHPSSAASSRWAATIAATWRGSTS